MSATGVDFAHGIAGAEDRELLTDGRAIVAARERKGKNSKNTQEQAKEFGMKSHRSPPWLCGYYTPRMGLEKYSHLCLMVIITGKNPGCQ
jgi:hypothetical protein